ncbi:MAG: UDP-N-acetylmuramate--L-alanine ligase [bacterium]|nr:UDP-N-acetylmuramate--L-alanine ligase [bacterium]
MKIHCVGIGGIGISALAQYYLAKRWKVSGSDLMPSEITDLLKKKGAKISIGPHVKKNVPKDADRIVFSPAVSNNNPELKGAKRVMSYPQALGELTKEFTTIAVSGTHGKSTTSSMIGLLLQNAGLDPTVIVGTKLKEFGGSNFRMGKGKYLVIEADEHFASFLHYRPRMIVLTTVEEDHLDYYKNLNSILSTFKKYLSLLPKDGIVVANGDDPNVKRIVGKRKANWYSLRQKEAQKVSQSMAIPGKHNVSNGLAVLAVARALGIPDKIAYRTLSRYQGSWRRFEIFKVSHPKPFTLLSDYGHHPTEIKVTVDAAKQKWPGKKIWLVFQPHQYQRTYYLWDDFVRVLSAVPVQKLILCDIYDVAGREEGSTKKRVSSAKLAKAIGTRALYIPTLPEVRTYLKKNLKGGEIVMVMGAGDIYSLALALTKKRKRENI